MLVGRFFLGGFSDRWGVWVGECLGLVAHEACSCANERLIDVFG